MKAIKPFHWVLAIIFLAIPISFSGYAAGEEDAGYCLADVAGTWSDDREIKGNLSSGAYLAKNQMGSLGGPFFGTNITSEEGSMTWIGESIGTFEGKPLTFSGAAAGSITSSSAFSGTGSGVANPQ